MSTIITCERTHPLGAVALTPGSKRHWLRGAGIAVNERSIGWNEVLDADEIFSTGNYGKVLPVSRVETRDLQPGPVYTKARELYWEFAHGG